MNRKSFIKILLVVAASITLAVYLHFGLHLPEYTHLLTALALTAWVTLLLTSWFIRYKQIKLRSLQEDRYQQLSITPKVAGLTFDDRAVFDGFVVYNLHIAEERRLLYQTWGGVLTTLTGVLSIVATLTDLDIIQRTGSGFAAIATFIMSTFSVPEFATQYQRSAFLLNELIYKWLAETGVFTDDARLQRLIGEVTLILDTDESSFIGANNDAVKPELPIESGRVGSVVNGDRVDASVPVISSPPTEDISLSGVTNDRAPSDRGTAKPEQPAIADWIEFSQSGTEDTAQFVNQMEMPIDGTLEIASEYNSQG
jgi:hypothetical protein